jgi:hypothetical protein
VPDKRFEAAAPPQSIGSRRRPKLRQLQRIEVAREAIVQLELAGVWTYDEYRQLMHHILQGAWHGHRVRQQYDSQSEVRVHAGAHSAMGPSRALAYPLKDRRNSAVFALGGS